MATYVLVHGAWGGSWGYASLARALRAAGHDVHVPSLTGLGERAHLAHGGITLSDHIADVVSLIDCEDLSDIILVGHSYGGMVVTGVSALRGKRIRSLVYLDAFLPQDGQALWDVADEATRRLYIENQKGTPGLVQPIFPMPEGRTRRVSGHPLLTLLEPVKLGGEESAISRRVYVYANASPLTIFTQFRDRCLAEEGWSVHEIATGHMVWDEDLPGVTKILLDEAAADLR
ncbi:alpha/beta hydrolase [Sphingobium lignivorans]|uniref:Pimeloyl-ACP methyl ester carboxylesterase n=1 Tax=Sphingobium lignivorans TaxID=2735886 RepID=A0ABR6NFW1_9SPHN|nr:alpha/beta hydrolase [Sphingobium lignivorans]MBB5986163.1 pimeloyl-ACP methyl ester carboxylesterase [Sphingobium lignivorans]